MIAYIYIYMHIYILHIFSIHRGRILWSSYRKLVWVRFKPTTIEFRADALTDWAIGPWVQQTSFQLCLPQSPRICIYLYVYMSTYVYIYMCLYICLYMFICIYVNVYTVSYPDIFPYHWISMGAQILSPNFSRTGLVKRL